LVEYRARLGLSAFIALVDQRHPSVAPRRAALAFAGLSAATSTRLVLREAA
jgi:hypothetical protein